MKIFKEKLITVGVLSGNRNYEARIDSSVAKANYLLTPSMVIAFAIAGTVKWNPKTEPIGFNSNTNEPVFLSQIWPTRQELFDLTMNKIMPQIFLDVEKNLSVSICALKLAIGQWAYNQIGPLHEPFPNLKLQTHADF
jgi:aconitase A